MTPDQERDEFHRYIDYVEGQLQDANIEVDLLRHVIERLTGDTVEKAVKKVSGWDQLDMDVIRYRQEAGLQ